jgi:hypothetical protein
MNAERKIHANLVGNTRVHVAEMHFQKMLQKRTLKADT